eukprot:7390309-Prymnesium_polylepis.1
MSTTVQMPVRGRQAPYAGGRQAPQLQLAIVASLGSVPEGRRIWGCETASKPIRFTTRPPFQTASGSGAGRLRRLTTVKRRVSKPPRAFGKRRRIQNHASGPRLLRF